MPNFDRRVRIRFSHHDCCAATAERDSVASRDYSQCASASVAARRKTTIRKGLHSTIYDSTAGGDSDFLTDLTPHTRLDRQAIHATAVTLRQRCRYIDCEEPQCTETAARLLSLLLPDLCWLPYLYSSPPRLDRLLARPSKCFRVGEEEAGSTGEQPGVG